MPSDIESKFVTINEFCQRAHCHRSSFYRFAKEGNLVIKKAGKKVLIDTASMESYLSNLPRAVYA